MFIKCRLLLIASVAGGTEYISDKVSSGIGHRTLNCEILESFDVRISARSKEAQDNTRPYLCDRKIKLQRHTGIPKVKFPDWFQDTLFLP